MMHTRRQISNSHEPHAWWHIVGYVVVFMSALSLRLCYLYETTDSPLFQTFQVDTQWHAEWALRIASSEPATSEPFFRAPLYPYVLAQLYRICGQSFLGARVIQHVFGAISCVLLAVLTTRVINRRAGLIAGGIAACYGPLWYFENELLIAWLSVFLLTALLLVVESAMRKATLSRWLIVGLLLGLCSIARPNFLLFGPVIMVWWCVRRDHHKPCFRPMIAMCIGTCIPIVPVTAHNVSAGDWVLISSQGGVNFFIGNNPTSDGKTATAMGENVPYADDYVDNVWQDSVDIAEADVGRSLRASEVSRYWFAQGFDFWRQDPVSAMSLLARKAYYFVNGYEIESNRSLYLDRLWSHVFSWATWESAIAFPLGLILPLGVVGMWSLRKQHPLLVLMSWLAIVYSVSVVAFFVTGRFRMPVVVMLVVFSAGTCDLIWRVLQQASYNRLKRMALALVVLIALCNSSFWGVRDVDNFRQTTILAYAHVQSGRYMEAIELYRQALALKPDQHVERFNLALALRTIGHVPQAAAEFEQVIALAPQDPNIRDTYASTLVSLGRVDEAIIQYRRALEIDPSFVLTYANLGITLISQGQFSQARPLLERAIEFAPEQGKYYYLLGLCDVQAQAYEPAVTHFEQAIEHGAALEGHIELGKLYERHGKLREAHDHLLAATQIAPRSAEAHLWLGIVAAASADLTVAIVAFEQAIAHDPTLGVAHYNLARALAEVGDLGRGREHAQIAQSLGLTLDPGLKAHLQLD